MFDLTGMTALVTGASGGIGSAIAKGLAAQGARLAVSGSNVEKLEAFRAGLSGLATLALWADIATRPGLSVETLLAGDAGHARLTSRARIASLAARPDAARVTLLATLATLAG